MDSSSSIIRRLTRFAREAPERIAVAAPAGVNSHGGTQYREITFRELEESTLRIAAGLHSRGARPGKRLVLFVPFGIEFIQLTFGVLRSGATLVLIDPGMGRGNVFRCLSEVRPDGFIAIPAVHWARQLLRWKLWDPVSQVLAAAKLNVTVGPRIPGAWTTLHDLLQPGNSPAALPESGGRDPAAIIFTSGSTGPPKGVMYEHGMFDAQVDLIQRFYGIQPGEIDLPGFPLFGLFNACMGVTTIVPEMDPTRPADVDPAKILAAISERQVTQAFGSPAFWNRVGRYCQERGHSLPTLRRALSAGGPVPLHVVERLSRALTFPGAELHTPYGATESLPVASVGSQEVLAETAPLTRQGRGTCVGRCFPGVEVRIIEIADGPLADISQCRTLPAGAIGEIIVRSPAVTREYFNRPDFTQRAKIPDGETFWHRIGDVGYFDEQQRLWFCGRQAHIVQTAAGQLFSVCCEAIFNNHPAIFRSALVGVGKKPQQVPVIVAEPEQGKFPESREQQAQLQKELLELGTQQAHTAGIREILFHPSLPVDTRHNVKINREALAEWAAGLLGASPRAGSA